MSTTPVVLLAVLWYLRSCKDDSLPELHFNFEFKRDHPQGKLRIFRLHYGFAMACKITVTEKKPSPLSRIQSKYTLTPKRSFMLMP